MDSARLGVRLKKRIRAIGGADCEDLGGLEWICSLVWSGHMVESGRVGSVTGGRVQRPSGSSKTGHLTASEWLPS